MAAAASILLLATLDTKAEETAYLVERLAEYGHLVDVIDTRLSTPEPAKPAQSKVEAMQASAVAAQQALEAKLAAGARIVVGLGGGTGAQIIAAAIAELPFALPKVLITTMASDPRPDTADNSIILIPSVSDLMGLNPTVRQVLQNAAAVIAGFAERGVVHPHVSAKPTVGLTALGITSGGVTAANNALRARDLETTVFHANGFGGKAFARWADCGAFIGVIDYTIHELNYLLFGGSHVVPEGRFDAASAAGLAQVIAPGGVNVRTRGALATLGADELRRPHYSHSPVFTHVALNNDEMARAGAFVGERLASARTPSTLVLPMGGFSSEDRPGGAVENRTGREVFAAAAIAAAGPTVRVLRLDDVHINDPAAAEAAVAALVSDLAVAPTS